MTDQQGSVSIFVPSVVPPKKVLNLRHDKKSKNRQMRKRAESSIVAPATTTDQGSLRGVRVVHLSRKRKREETSVDSVALGSLESEEFQSEDEATGPVVDSSTEPAGSDHEEDDYVHLEQGGEVRDLFVSYYSINWTVSKQLLAALASAEQSPEQFHDNMVAALHTSVSSNILNAIYMRQQRGKTIAEKGRGSLLFNHMFTGTPLPYIYGVTFSNWNRVWMQDNVRRKQHLSAQFVARQVLQFLEEQGEWAEPDVAFPIIDVRTGILKGDREVVEARVKKQIESARLLALEEATKVMDDVVRGKQGAFDENISKRTPRYGLSRSVNTVDELWQKDSLAKWSEFDWGQHERIIPLALLPFMVLVMGKTRDSTFQMYNNPFGVLMQSRLYLHSIRTLFLDANRGCYAFDRASVPFTVHAALMADEQCTAAFQILTRFYGPLELVNTKAVEQVQKLTTSFTHGARLLQNTIDEARRLRDENRVLMAKLKESD